MIKFAQTFLHALNQRVSAWNVMIEMTESIFSTNYEQLSETLAESKDYRIDTAIDDFGMAFLHCRNRKVEFQHG